MKPHADIELTPEQYLYCFLFFYTLCFLFFFFLWAAMTWRQSRHHRRMIDKKAEQMDRYRNGDLG